MLELLAEINWYRAGLGFLVGIPIGVALSMLSRKRRR